MSQVHLTSLAVNGLPSCHRTPLRNGNVNSVPSSLQDQPVARSGTIVPRLLCLACWSNITRLLKTPIIGRSAMMVASSWIDMLAGLSTVNILRMPPAFCADPGSPLNRAAHSGPAIAMARIFLAICASLGSTREKPAALFSETLILDPKVLKAVAVVDAIDHQSQPLHP